MRRLPLLLLAATLLSGVHQVAGAQTVEEVVAIIHERAAAHGVSGARLERIARCESGPHLNRWAVGRQGEQGLFQLHPNGLRRLFYQRGFTDVWDVEQQASFAAWAFANGFASHWSCR
jgi:hypothetical protein